MLRIQSELPHQLRPAHHIVKRKELECASVPDVCRVISLQAAARHLAARHRLWVRAAGGGGRAADPQDRHPHVYGAHPPGLHMLVPWCTDVMSVAACDTDCGNKVPRYAMCMLGCSASIVQMNCNVLLQSSL